MLVWGAIFIIIEARQKIFNMQRDTLNYIELFKTKLIPNHILHAFKYMNIVTLFLHLPL